MDWRGIDAVVFDVDGTLYRQGPLRLRMAAELALAIAANPWRWRVAQMLSAYRKAVEGLAGVAAPDGLEAARLTLASARCGAPPKLIAEMVEEWMGRRPLRHLPACRRDGTVEFFAQLRMRGLRLGALSEYPATAKLSALGLVVDIAAHAADPAINCGKPDPVGLEWVCRSLGTAPGRCLMIGDRDDRDGAMARAAGARFLLVGQGRLKSFRPLLG
ncbi:MAG: HAD family hydrolase [Magnetospirillum sp.]|nr:HAD family hydrolase [Magnetospirillum sp.]